VVHQAAQQNLIFRPPFLFFMRLILAVKRKNQAKPSTDLMNLSRFSEKSMIQKISVPVFQRMPARHLYDLRW
jgi:hypothetical protein